jgi:hypothetical protein
MFVKLLKANSSGIRYTIFHNMHIISSGWTHKHVRIKYLLDTDFSLVHTYYIHVV